MTLILHMISFILSLAFYFLPTIIAGLREHRNIVPIFLTNFFFGWTGLGWLFTLIWAFWNDKKNNA